MLPILNSIGIPLWQTHVIYSVIQPMDGRRVLCDAMFYNYQVFFSTLFRIINSKQNNFPTGAKKQQQKAQKIVKGGGAGRVGGKR